MIIINGNDRHIDILMSELRNCLTLKNLRGDQNDPLKLFWNNSREKMNFQQNVSYS